MREIIRKGISMAKSCKAVGTRILELSKKFLGYQVITGATRNKGKNNKLNQLSIRIYQWSGIAKVVGTRSRENNGEYLRNLLVKQAIISNKVLSEWK